MGLRVHRLWTADYWEPGAGGAVFRTEATMAASLAARRQ